MTRYRTLFAALLLTLCPSPASALCPGDCNDDGEVTVDEIVTGVSIALGTLEIDACSRFDSGGDRFVTVEEILQAVSAALGGCTDTTPAPTATATPLVGSSVAQRLAGTIDVSTRVFAALPNVIGALLGQANAARSSRIAAPKTAPRGLIDLPFDCPAGGDGAIHCSQRLSGFPPQPVAEYTLELNDCQVAVDDGRTLRIDGQAELEGERGDLCGELSDELDLNIDAMTVESTGGAIETTTTLTEINGKLELDGDDAQCGANQIGLRLSGAVGVESKLSDGTPIATVGATLDDTRFDIDVSSFGAGCVPAGYTMIVNGEATIRSAGTSIAVDYIDLRLAATPGDASSAIEISGGLSADCIAGSVSLTTPSLLIFGIDESCARSGKVDVSAGTNSGAIRYLDGGVDIDADADGNSDAVFPSCHDPALFVCPA